MQKICVDLISREFGKSLGMKSDTDNDDVPRWALIHSKLSIATPEAAKVLSVTENDDETVIEISTSSEDSSSDKISSVTDDKEETRIDFTPEKQRRHEIRDAQCNVILTVEPGATWQASR